MRTESRLALAIAATAGALGLGCGADATCGPGEAAADGIVLTVAGRERRFEGFTSSANNDCTAGAVTSLTIEGHQVGAPDRVLVLCLPAPDAIGADPISLSDADRIQLIDLFADQDGCALSIDRTGTSSGTATFDGYCAAGADPAGYALALDGTLALKQTCGEAVEMLAGTIAGAAAVVAD